jgi:hypothetical protein
MIRFHALRCPQRALRGVAAPNPLRTADATASDVLLRRAD